MTWRDRYGPWALVVGASDGIGAAFADALAGRGLDVILVARRADLLAELAARLEQTHGVRTRVLVADVSTGAGVEAVARTRDEVGLVVCNAAAAPVAPFLTLPADQLDRMLDLNCRAAAHLAHAFGTRMVERRRGGVVLLSSMASLQGTALVAHYAATKAYLRVLAEGLWAEWRDSGVDVLACCPGLVRTPTFERGSPRPAGALVPPPMTPDTVVRAALSALGRAPVVIPGWRNRAVTAAAKLLPRASVIRLASARTAAIYPTESHRRAPADGGSG